MLEGEVVAHEAGEDVEDLVEAARQQLRLQHLHQRLYVELVVSYERVEVGQRVAQ